MSASATTTVTLTEQSAVQQRALEVVNLGGNVHGFGTAPSNPPPAPAMPQGPGNVTGTGTPSAANQALRDLHMERLRRQGQLPPQPAAAPPPAPVAASSSEPAPAPPSASTSEGEHQNPTLRLRSGGPRVRSGAPDPGPPGGGGSRVVQGFDPDIWRLLDWLDDRRLSYLRRLVELLELYQIIPLCHLNMICDQLVDMTLRMQALEFSTAVRIAGSGPPGDPRRGGSSAVIEDQPPPLHLHLPPSPQAVRFQQALAQIQAQQNLLLAGQQQRAARRQAFEGAQQNIAAQLQPAPTQNWRELMDRHRNFVNATLALNRNPPPVQPTASWRQITQQRQNYLDALRALQLNPPPVQPGQAWRTMVQQHQNFVNATRALILRPPRPLLQPAPRRNRNYAPMAYAVPAPRARHILHGDHAGGQHMGRYNPALRRAPPDQVTHHNFPGHFVSYFPVAWDPEDVIAAIIEAAQATYHLAWQQPNGRWMHPPVWVTRRGITIQIVVVSDVNHAGNLIVFTAWTQ